MPMPALLMRMSILPTRRASGRYGLRLRAVADSQAITVDIGLAARISSSVS
jgi:hypothetical protein